MKIRLLAELVREDVETVDGRLIRAEATVWRSVPLALLWQPEDAHDGAERVGEIRAIWRKDNVVWGRLDIPDAPRRLRRQLREGAVSVGVDAVVVVGDPWGFDGFEIAAATMVSPPRPAWPNMELIRVK